MKSNTWLSAGLGMLMFTPFAIADEPKAVKYELFDGYFVSNKFEPDAAESFVIIVEQRKFDDTFGVAFVMGDQSHRLPKNVFDGNMIIAIVKRGMALYDYKLAKIVEKDGELEVHYSAKASPQAGATFSCPLIVGVPKREYKSLKFIESEKVAKTIQLKN